MPTNFALFHTTIDTLYSSLSQRGILSRVGLDFRQLKREIARQPLRHGLLNQFDPDGVLHKAKSAFWICGYDENEELVYTQAAQLLDLNGGSVAEYLSRNRFDYAPAAPPVDPSSVRTVPGPRVFGLTGKAVYHGEMWLHPKYRRKGIPHLIVRFGLNCAAAVWNPDCVFGLMNWALACEGFNNQIGYTLCEPMTMLWDRSDSQESHQVWCVFMERSDIHFMIDFDSEKFINTIMLKNR